MKLSIKKKILKIKYKALGKIKNEKKFKSSPDLKKLHEEKGRILAMSEGEDKSVKLSEIENFITKKLAINQRENLSKEIEDISNMHNKKRKTATVFRVKDRIYGSKENKTRGF